MIATLPMYDWPERRTDTDARWAPLRAALRAEGFDAPDHLARDENLAGMWLSPDLLIGETCSQPLATLLAGTVRYVATPVHDAPGCGQGTYRSVIVRRGPGADLPSPESPDASIPASAVSGRMAANETGSMSGFVAPARDMNALGLAFPDEGDTVFTGSHRASIQAVAAGEADFAAIDCVTWQIAVAHEPAARELHIVGWTALRPGLPLITSLRFDDAALERIRRAVLASIPAVVLDPPIDPARRPDPRP